MRAIAALRRRRARWCFRRRRQFNLDQIVLDRVYNQVPNRVKAQFPHDVAAVRLYCLGA